jgi:seryl-tRNA synthetase
MSQANKKKNISNVSEIASDISDNSIKPDNEVSEDEEINSEENVNSEEEKELALIGKKNSDKKKESFEDQMKKIDTVRNMIKNLDKEINDMIKSIKGLQKTRNDYERQIYNIYKNLPKTHSDEINMARKEKKKRKGNVHGGFNKECLVPEILSKFLNLPDGIFMSRPKVMSALNNKFNELKIKSGQNTTLNEVVVKELGLPQDNIGRVIKFTEFQAFLASFYPKKLDVIPNEIEE